MKKIQILAALTAALLAGLSTLALTAGAQPSAHASACKFGKEAAGCKLNGTGYYDAKSRVIVGFASLASASRYPTALSIPSESVCAAATGATISVSTHQTPKIGGSLSFTAKPTFTSQFAEGTTNIKSAKLAAKLKITNAKQASLSGSVAVTLTNGTKCARKLPGKLKRVLGG